MLLSYRSLGAARGLTIYNGGAALIHKQWHFSSGESSGQNLMPRRDSHDVSKLWRRSCIPEADCSCIVEDIDDDGNHVIVFLRRNTCLFDGNRKMRAIKPTAM